MWLLVCSDSEIADFISDNAEQHLQQGFPLIFRGEVIINYAIFLFSFHVKNKFSVKLYLQS